MVNLKETGYYWYKIYLVADSAIPPVEPQILIETLLITGPLENKGRGGIKILNIGGRSIACRKYIHGGLFRAITGDVFFTGKRAKEELEIMLYLKEKGFPVVQPYGLIIRTYFFTKTLYLLTVFEENASDLLDVLKRSTQRERYRIIVKLAQLMWRLETLGVYHPDLHLNNMLITIDNKMKYAYPIEAQIKIPPRPPFPEQNHFGTGLKGGWDFRIIFLDFDRAHRKPITKKDMEHMFWRLNRYAEKMERDGKLKVELKEKALFLKAYQRLSGFDMTRIMGRKVGLKRFLSQIGWFFESLLHGGKGSRNEGRQKSKIQNPKSKISK